MRKTVSILLAFCAAQTIYGDIAWSAAETLSSELVQASEPQVVIDQEGNATAIWIENDAIITKTKTFNGSWSIPEVLVNYGADAPQIAIDARYCQKLCFSHRAHPNDFS